MSESDSVFRQKRRERKWTLKRAVQEMGLPESAFSWLARLERGEIGDPGSDRFLRACRIYGIEMDGSALAPPPAVDVDADLEVAGRHLKRALEADRPRVASWLRGFMTLISVAGVFVFAGQEPLRRPQARCEVDVILRRRRNLAKPAQKVA